MELQPKIGRFFNGQRVLDTFKFLNFRWSLIKEHQILIVQLMLINLKSYLFSKIYIHIFTSHIFFRFREK